MNRTHYMLLASLSALTLHSCNSESEETTSAEGGYPAEQVAEALYQVLKSDRKVYAQKIVNRLVKKEGVIKAHEEWESEKALLLPAQFFREGAEEVDGIEDKAIDFTYSLQSKWPLNLENAKKIKKKHRIPRTGSRLTPP